MTSDFRASCNNICCTVFFNFAEKRIVKKYGFGVESILGYAEWYSKQFNIPIDADTLRAFYTAMAIDKCKLPETKVKHIIDYHLKSSGNIDVAKYIITCQLRCFDKEKYYNNMIPYRNEPDVYNAVRHFVRLAKIDTRQFLMLDNESYLRHIWFDKFGTHIGNYFMDAYDRQSSIDDFRKTLVYNRLVEKNASDMDILKFLEQHASPNTYTLLTKRVRHAICENHGAICENRGSDNGSDDDALESESEPSQQETSTLSPPVMTTASPTPVQPLSPNECSHGGCYLLQREVDHDQKNNRYKIGKGENVIQRVGKESSYKNAYIKCIIGVRDPDACEKDIINVFRSKFKNIKEAERGSYGNEIFEGDIKDMLSMFQSICNKYT